MTVVNKIVLGPTYREMLHPELVPETICQAALRGAANELDPVNLFNINWRGAATACEAWCCRENGRGLPRTSS